MTTKPITQREAQELRKRVAILEQLEDDRRNNWVMDYPGGRHLGSIVISDVDAAKIRTARLLEHAVVVTNGDRGEIHLYALPVAKEPNA